MARGGERRRGKYEKKVVKKAKSLKAYPMDSRREEIMLK